MTNYNLQGMAYIHSSGVKFHGKLSSTNCVIDGRFMLKLTDYGIPSVYEQDSHYMKRNNVTVNQSSMYLYRPPSVYNQESHYMKPNNTVKHSIMYVYRIVIPIVYIWPGVGQYEA